MYINKKLNYLSIFKNFAITKCNCENSSSTTIPSPLIISRILTSTHYYSLKSRLVVV